ncbi:hypothetical protein [Capsulimonas corticalis]|nr:hypothetical protein [Capsulimonas corticalis]
MSNLLLVMGRQGANINKNIRPGLPRQKIVEKASLLPFKLTDHLIDLYEYCDGVTDRPRLTANLIDDGRFMSLDEAVRHYRNLTFNAASASDDYQGTWFPLLYAESGECTVVECGDGTDRGQIISYDVEMGISVQYLSLESMFKTVTQYWIEGLYSLVDGFWQPSSDSIKFGRIGARMNPGADYWNYVS